MGSYQLLFLIIGITCLLCLVPECQSTSLAQSECSNQDVPHYQRLGSKYEMRFGTTNTSITVCVKVQTTGWVGFGFGPKAGMLSADLHIGGVKNGQTYSKDLYGISTKNTRPKDDKRNDWTLLHGTESNGFTTLVLKRDLDTCDPNVGQDFKIGRHTTRVLWSFHVNDPKDITQLSTYDYHGTTNRGSKSFLLLDPPLVEHDVTYLNQTDPNIVELNFTMINYTVPSDSTTYACKIVKLPDHIRKKKHHLIRWEPIIDKGRTRLIHHLVLYFCLTFDDILPLGKQHSCFNYRPPQEMICEKDVFLVWTVGGTPYDFPKEVGLPVGGPGRKIYFKLEVHYDNPDETAGMIDNSGFRMILTDTPRKYDAGLWRIGTRISHNHLIPPHFTSLTSRGYCLKECFEEYMTAENVPYVTIFGGLLHTHLAGRKIRSRHFRKGVELEPILEDKYYDFNYQETRALHKPKRFYKGDMMITDCVYSTMDRDKVTVAGFPTDQEMCFVYLLFYPELNMTSCESDVIWTDDVIEHTRLFQNSTLYDWTQKAVRDKFVKDQDAANFTQFCYGINAKDVAFNGTIHSQFILTNTYKEPSTCASTTTSTSSG